MTTKASTPADAGTKAPSAMTKAELTELITAERERYAEALAELEAVAGERDELDHKLEAYRDRDEPLVAKIAAAMSEAGTVIKNSVNAQQSYKYASAEAILGAVRKPLLERGVILLPGPTGFTEEAIVSGGGSKGSRVILDLEFTFTDGTSTIARPWRGEGQDYGDKAYGKAYTNAIKTFVRSAWLLPTEHDDPEATPSGERKATAPAPVMPAWSVAAKDAPSARLEADLTKLVGLDGARELMAAIDLTTGGGIPIIVAKFGRGIVARMEGEAERAAAAGAQDADAEQPDPPAPDDVAPAERLPGTVADVDAAGFVADLDANALHELTADDAPAELRDAAAAELARREEIGNALDQEHPPELPLAPATIPMPNLEGKGPAVQIGTLKSAGCTCPDPLGHRAPTPVYSDSCPIIGHGRAL